MPPNSPVSFSTGNKIRISTGIRILDDPRGVRAATVVAKLDAALQRYWKDRRRGRDRDGEARYEQACNRAAIPLCKPEDGVLGERVKDPRVLPYASC